MKLSKIGRISAAAVAAIALGLGMTACGGGTIGYLYVLGTQYGQISGLKIDDYTGNLTQTVGSPYSAGGANPVSLAIRPGGRYVYVVNAGNSTTAGGLAVFTVGGDGILTYQTTYTTEGGTPVWVTTDSGGNFVYVLDRLDPTNTPANIANGTATGNGDVTVYGVNSSTGRLTLVPNQQQRTPTGTQLTYFPVGPNPTMMKTAGSCLFTLDSGDKTIFPYTTSGQSGQLTLTANSNVATGASLPTSISVGSSNLFLTDAGTNQILPYTVGQNCALNVQTGGAVPNISGTSNPVNSLFVTGNSINFLYVINQSTTNGNQANSTISAFSVDTSTGRLQPTGSRNNPYTVGSVPVCIVEDPSSKYIYTSNNGDDSVSGKQFNKSNGELQNLVRGTSFTVTGRPSCLAVTGAIY